MNDTGWIKLYRSLKDWQWSTNPFAVALFVHILLSTNREDKMWQGIKVPRGSFITSLSKLSHVAGFTVQQTRSALAKLKSTGEITIKTSNKYTVITINNYTKYQSPTSETTNKQQTNNKQTTTTKEVKKSYITPLPPLFGEKEGDILVSSKSNSVIQKTPGSSNRAKARYGGLTLFEVGERVLEAYKKCEVGNFKSYESFLNNLEYWLKTYTPTEVGLAIYAMSKDTYWGPIIKGNKEIIFYKKNPRGENVDYIGKFLHVYQTKYGRKSESAK